MAFTGHKIFKESVQTLFGEEPFGGGQDDKCKGRDAELNAARNEHLIYRYYYYLTYTDKRWEAIRPLLAQEFYLSEQTILNLIKENADLRRRIMSEKPTLRQIKEKYEIRW